MWVGAAIVVAGAGAVASSEAQRKAASKAAGAAQNAANAQTDSQERIFDIQRQDFAPYQQTGNSALPTLMQLSGYNVGMSTPEMEQQYIQQQIASNEELKGLQSKLAALKAAGPESQRLTNTLSLRTTNGAAGNYARQRAQTAEESALNDQINSLTESIRLGAFDKGPLYQMNGQYYSRSPLAKMEESDGYKWQLEQGERNTNRALAARGKYDSGQAYGILNDSVYRPLAAQEADKFYNRQLGLVGIGQGAAGQVAGAAQNYGNNMTNIYGALGQAQGNAALAKGQAQAGLYSSLGSLPMNAVGTYALGKYAGLWGGSPTATPTK